MTGAMNVGGVTRCKRRYAHHHGRGFRRKPHGTQHRHRRRRPHRRQHDERQAEYSGEGIHFAHHRGGQPADRSPARKRSAASSASTAARSAARLPHFSSAKRGSFVRPAARQAVRSVRRRGAQASRTSKTAVRPLSRTRTPQAASLRKTRLRARSRSAGRPAARFPAATATPPVSRRKTAAPSARARLRTLRFPALAYRKAARSRR